MIEDGLEAAVGDRIAAERHNVAVLSYLVEELLEQEEVVIWGVAIHAEVEPGVLPLIMARRDLLRKHKLFRSKRITRRWWRNPKSCGLTTGKSMKNTRVSCATYKACCGTLSSSPEAAPDTCSLTGACLRTSALCERIAD